MVIKLPLNGSSKYAASLPLNNFAKNVYSQNGEDGILLELLRRLKLTDQTGALMVVEFGAWDGKHLSNTFNLVRLGSSAIYIESDSAKFSVLLLTCKEYPKIVPVHCRVDRWGLGESSLKSILKLFGAPTDFDILSIDFDSFDLDVWETLEGFEPKIVIIEINSSILPGIISRQSDKTFLNSFTATVNVGHSKGYVLVCHTGNLIFVHKDYINEIQFPERFKKYPELLFLYDSYWINESYVQNKLSLPYFIKEMLPGRLRKFLSKFHTRNMRKTYN